MATYSSKQEKRQGLVDPIFVLISIALIGVFVVLGPFGGGMYNPFSSAFGAQGAGSVSLSDGGSFASDLQYWDVNCSHGWTSDAACDTLVSKTQSCLAGTGSAYCSQYDTYLQSFRGR